MIELAVQMAEENYRRSVDADRDKTPSDHDSAL
jgi:hypothetical protein